MAVRRFTNTTGEHFKFWSIERVGKSNVVRYGRIGTKGQVRTKRFNSTAGASFAASRLVTEKLLKGYIEDGGTVILEPKSDLQKPGRPVNVERLAEVLPDGRMITFGDEE